MTKTVKVHSKQIHITGEMMYLRLLAVNAHKKVPLDRVMSSENLPTPPSLFYETGTMLYGTKSDFLHKLEDLV